MEYTRKELADIPGHVTSQRSRQATVSTGQGQGHLSFYHSSHEYNLFALQHYINVWRFEVRFYYLYALYVYIAIKIMCCLILMDVTISEAEVITYYAEEVSHMSITL